MKVFKIYSEDYYYAYSSETEEDAVKLFIEEQGDLFIDKIEEIPESKWDEKVINVWEDNDFDTEPWQVSIREEISKTPQLIFTNDYSNF
jgi:hypothetical protein